MDADYGNARAVCVKLHRQFYVLLNNMLKKTMYVIEKTFLVMRMDSQNTLNRTNSDIIECEEDGNRMMLNKRLRNERTDIDAAYYVQTADVKLIRRHHNVKNDQIEMRRNLYKHEPYLSEEYENYREVVQKNICSFQCMRDFFWSESICKTSDRFEFEKYLNTPLCDLSNGWKGQRFWVHWNYLNDLEIGNSTCTYYISWTNLIYFQNSALLRFLIDYLKLVAGTKGVHAIFITEKSKWTTSWKQQYSLSRTATKS